MPFDDLLKLDVHHLDIMLVIGLAIFFGTVGAKIFQRLHIPQIIGYVTIGILLGPVLKVISPEAIESFDPFNFFALGIIGFLIGGELKSNIFQRFGKQIFSILLFEVAYRDDRVFVRVFPIDLTFIDEIVINFFEISAAVKHKRFSCIVSDGRLTRINRQHVLAKHIGGQKCSGLESEIVALS